MFFLIFFFSVALIGADLTPDLLLSCIEKENYPEAHRLLYKNLLDVTQENFPNSFLASVYSEQFAENFNNNNVAKQLSSYYDGNEIEKKDDARHFFLLHLFNVIAHLGAKKTTFDRSLEEKLERFLTRQACDAFSDDVWNSRDAQGVWARGTVFEIFFNLFYDPFPFSLGATEPPCVRALRNTGSHWIFEWLLNVYKAPVDGQQKPNSPVLFDLYSTRYLSMILYSHVKNLSVTCFYKRKSEYFGGEPFDSDKPLQLNSKHLERRYQQTLKKFSKEIEFAYNASGVVTTDDDYGEALMRLLHIEKFTEQPHSRAFEHMTQILYLLFIVEKSALNGYQKALFKKLSQKNIDAIFNVVNILNARS